MRITLTTTGRRSGEPRSATLYAWPDGERLVVVGSRGGHADDPAWVGNLRATPRATILRARRRTAEPMVAREVDGAEHERLWELVCAAFPMYASYQRKTDRRIPLFVLEADVPAGS